MWLSFYGAKFSYIVLLMKVNLRINVRIFKVYIFCNDYNYDYCPSNNKFEQIRQAAALLFLIQIYYQQKLHLFYKIMIEGLHSNQSKSFARSIYPSGRLKVAHRELVKPNQIFITDFSPVQPHFQKKKKRCPLFLLNRSSNKKSNKKGSIFTSQGIMLQTAVNPEKYPVIGEKKSLNSAKDKACSSLTKKQMQTSAFNFTKTRTPKNSIQTKQNTNDFPLYYFYPQNRFLKSALTQRESRQKSRVNQRRTMSNIKDKLKSEGREFQANNFGAWRTIQVDFDEVI